MDPSNRKRRYISFRSEEEANAAIAAAKRQQELIKRYTTQQNQNVNDKSKRIIQKRQPVERQIPPEQESEAENNRFVDVHHENGEGDVNSQSRPLNFYECRICGEDPRNAVVTICGHLFCWPCLWEFEKTRLGETCCPLCECSLQLHEDIIPYYASGVDENVFGTETERAGTVMRPSAFRIDTSRRGCPWFIREPLILRNGNVIVARRPDHVNGDLMRRDQIRTLRTKEIIVVVLMILVWIFL